MKNQKIGIVRLLTPTDLPRVSELTMRAFMDSVAATLPPEGVTFFEQLATVEAYGQRMQEDNVFYVCEQGGQVQGVIEFKQGRHIAMMFVDPAHQRKGIGRALVESILPHARQSIITVSASLTSVSAYQQYGFKLAGEQAESHGLIYQPMERILSKVG